MLSVLQVKKGMIVAVYGADDINGNKYYLLQARSDAWSAHSVVSLCPHALVVVHVRLSSAWFVRTVCWLPAGLHLWRAELQALHAEALVHSKPLACPPKLEQATGPMLRLRADDTDDFGVTYGKGDTVIEG